MSPIDLRSDTVTRPTPEMYAAMQTAPLGDDVLLDDPTVAELEATAAAMMGKEAAVFVPSGTMGNQMAIATHTQPGSAMIVEEEAHVIYYEVGAPAILSAVLTWTLPSNHGVMDPATVEKRITKANLHTPGTSLICLENTHNRAGGTIIPMDVMAEYGRIAQKHGLKTHIDGARIFNASVALGVPVAEIAQHVDSVNFCLSKGLCSPVGSVLTGSKEFIERARIWRKRLGGGMRQAGILAACGLLSLNKMVDRLTEDHDNVQVLGKGIQGVPGLNVHPENHPTNLLMAETDRPAEEWQSALHQHGLWCFPAASHRLRVVTHADVSQQQIKQAIEIIREVGTQFAK
jgi:threonine aldolase